LHGIASVAVIILGFYYRNAYAIPIAFYTIYIFMLTLSLLVKLKEEEEEAFFYSEVQRRRIFLDYSKRMSSL